MPPTSPRSSEPQPARKPRRRRWLLRILLGLAILLVILLPLINGPIFRKIVHWQVGKALHDLYLEGDFEVGGTLLGGIELRDVQLVGSRNLQSLSLHHAEVGYELKPLIKGNWGEGLTKLHVTDLDAKIDTSRKFPTVAEIEERKAEKSAKKEEKGKDPRLWENLDALLQQDLQIADLNLQVISGGDHPLAVEDFNFQLKGGSGTVNASKISYPNGQVNEQLDAQLISNGEPVITIRSLDIAEELSVERLSVLHPTAPKSPPMLDGKLRLLGGELIATQESSQRWNAQLAGGEIDLAALGEWLDIDLAIAGFVDRLTASIDLGSGLGVHAEVGTRQLAYQDYGCDTATATVDYSKEKIEVNELSVASGASTVTGSATFLPEPKKLSATAKVNSPDLAELTKTFGLQPIGGALVADITSIELADGKLESAELAADATGLSYEGVSVAKVTLAATENSFELSSDLHGDASNRIESSGTFDIEATSYEAKAEINLPDLSALHPTLEALKIEPRPSGAIALNWEGKGAVRDQQHQGSAEVPEFDLQLDEGAPVSGRLGFAYEPESYQLTDFNVRSEELSIIGAAQLADERLDVEALRLFNGSLAIASADVSVPFDTSKLSGLESFLDQPGDVSIKIDSNKLQLADLVAMVGKPVDLAASVDAEINVGGTLANPEGTGRLDVLQLRKPSAEGLAPVDTNLNFSLGDGQLKVDGKLKHPELEAITIKGHTPLRVEKVADQAAQSIDLALHLPETGLELAKKYVPHLSGASGNASADLRVTGSIKTPQISGDVKIDSPLLKFDEQKIPTISDLDIAIHFEGNQVEIQSFQAYVAGGEISLGGGADLSNLSNPTLGFSLTAREALVLRDDNLSMRANADLELSGPLATAALTGKIGITQSRFFREIEILPIGLPGSSPTPAAPAAPSFPTKREIGVAAAPFKDWTVDIAVIDDDPFLIRSNLARGDVNCDLRISGTLGAPVPTGTVALVEGRATLPFSELEVKTATVNFSEQTKFDPEINVRAYSRVQDYEVNLFVYG
ncbi:MAG: translocation/assembly module TamB domain-containing protein, partial [Verrucomicrobiales bacterium]